MNVGFWTMVEATSLKSRFCRRIVGALSAVVLVAALPAMGQAQPAGQPTYQAGSQTVAFSQPKVRGITRLELGTLIDNPDAERWNRVVLLARPRIASGDVTSLSSSIRDTVSTFVLAIMATVEESVDPNTGGKKFRLAEVGAGYAVQVKDDLRIVELDGYEKLGIRLGFIQRQMLSENQKQLNTVRMLARTSTLTLFDVPALLNRDGNHEDFVMRHLVWIDSKSGKNSALVWLLKRDSLGELTLVDSEPARWIPAGMKEDRAIHVDGREFLLGGIPTEKAFALESMPPGKEVSWLPESKSLADASTYGLEDVQRLTKQLSLMLQQLRQPAN